MSTLYESDLKDHNLLFRGKVRDVYDLGDELLVVTSDRLSAFDVIMPNPIPGKGEVLNQITNFWMQKFSDVIPNHLVSTDVSDLVPASELDLYKNRSVRVKKCEPLPVECVARGYLIGSGWKDYQNTGQVCGIDLPKGLQQAEQLPEVIFTPATKAAVGDHDENISFAEVQNLIGNELAEKLRNLTITLYEKGAAYARERGIIIADTKFEFGLSDGEIVWIDEALSPDSSRFWPVSEYQVGMSPPSFDKQFVRDYLETLDWGKVAPGPNLPEDIIQKTADKYHEALKILTQPR